MKTLLPFFIIAFFPITLLADESVWKQFVQEQTLLIAHVDLNKIDVAAVIQNNQSLIETGDKILQKDIPDAKTLSPLAEMGKKYLTETLGIQEAYIVLNIQMFPSFFTVILPQTGKIDPQALQSALAPLDPKSWLEITPSSDNKYILIFGRMGEIADSERAKYIARHVPPVPAERPEFAEAFNAMENAPIKIASAIPEFAKKVLKDTLPKLPEPLDTLDMITPITQMRWKAVSVDPAKTEINATIMMTSEAAASQSVNEMKKAVPIILEKNIPVRFEIGSNSTVTLSGFRETLIKKQDLICSLLIPEAKGNTLHLQLSSPQFNSLIDLFTPLVVEMTRSRAERMSRQPCGIHVKSLILAMHNYHDSTEHLPPVYTMDNTGKPLHSWRVLLLPYLGEPELYAQIRLDEPWDSEHNKQFHDKMPAVFRCPTCTLGNPKRDTTYCVVVGTETMPPGGKTLTFVQFADGLSNTILVVERKTPVCWMEPVDVLQEDAYLGVNKLESGIGSEHPGGAMVGFLDGSCRWLLESADLKKLKAFLTKEGWEMVDQDGMFEATQ